MQTPVLILTWGNPSRGDDALGPAMFDLLEKHKHESGSLQHVEILTDFQLQIEHTMDIEGRDCVLFVDAGVSCRTPFECVELQAEQDDSYTTHAMSPASVLSVYRQVNHRDPPPACLLTIRAYEFGLGLPMSARAADNLQQAFEYIVQNIGNRHDIDLSRLLTRQS